MKSAYVFWIKSDRRKIIGEETKQNKKVFRLERKTSIQEKKTNNKTTTISKIQKTKHKFQVEQHGPQKRERKDQVPRRREDPLLTRHICRVLFAVIGKKRIR